MRAPTNPNRRVGDEIEPVAPYNLARQPSGNVPDDQYDDQPLVPTDACFWLFAHSRPEYAK